MKGEGSASKPFQKPTSVSDVLNERNLLADALGLCKNELQMFFLPSTVMNAPPQDTRVRLTVTTKEEAGRFAVAQRSISPGELVLASAPYGLVMNPKFCPSALYLSSRCTTSSTAGASRSDSGEDSKNGKVKVKTGKSSKKATPKHGAKGEAAAVDAAAAPYKDALYGEGSQNLANAPPTAAGPAALRWYTTQSAWCAVCFQEIPAGRWLCNRGSLAELAVDISWEQEELEKKLRLAEAAAAAKRKEEEGSAAGATVRSNFDEDVALEDIDDAHDVDAPNTTAATFRKLKKPTKSAKTRKDGAVELKQKLLERALTQREEIFYERRLQKKLRAEHGCPAVRVEGWEAQVPCDDEEKGGDTLNSVFTGAMSGCSGCGVLCYCSEACWRAYRTQHVESGECAVLRGLYPRLMSEYYATTAAAASSAQDRHLYGAVVLPGDEPLHWARSSSESKMLEFQSLLFSAVVLVRASREGYQSHFRNIAEDSPGIKDGNESSSAAATSQLVSKCTVDAGTASPKTTSATASPAPAAVASAGAVDSVILPKEVSTIQDIRMKAGLIGTVEVLDADAELRKLATQGDANTMQTECVRYTDNIISGDNTQTKAATELITDRTTFSLCVRLPRYADMAQMETNLSVISKPRRSAYQRYYRTFTKRVLPILHLLDTNDCETEIERAEKATPSDATKAAFTLDISESYFLRLCAAAQCNSFGVYDTNANCLAFGVYPEASYFNHSCLPNICRVMHHGGRVAAFYALRSISENEPLTISYTDVEQQNSAERRRNLLETYRFFCMCERCSGHAEGPTMAVARSGNTIAMSRINISNDDNCSNTSLNLVKQNSPALTISPTQFDKFLLLCTQCAIRGYLRPIPNAALSAPRWSMGDVPMRECTVCHCRVVRDVA